MLKLDKVSDVIYYKQHIVLPKPDGKALSKPEDRSKYAAIYKKS